MNRTRSNNNANERNAMNSSRNSNSSSLHFYDASQQQQPQQQLAFTSTAKLPIETVKKLIASVSRRPNLWIRQHSGQKRYDITQLWQEVSEEINLPADVCRIKWGHLRDNFRKVFIRNTLSDETPTTWRFYNDMRFMEKSVAENIMRQARYKEQTRYWPDFQQQQHHQQQQQQAMLQHPMIPICTLKENVKMDAESMQHFGIYTEPDEMETNTNKRIKLEPQDNFLNGHHHHQQQQGKLKYHHNNYHNNHQESIDEHEHDNEHEDDDDFDEDTTTDENEQKQEKDQLYTMKNYDEDDNTIESSNDGNKAPKKVNVLQGRTLTSETFSSLDDSKNFLTNNLKKTESLNGFNNEDHDSDRMFLLSLLPYLRNIDVNRKLQVRQKLQNVLIEELS